ncbi:MAG: GDP-L-fucose synthase [Desulfobacterales bacterium]|nr:GDP-L-fucose synthase [Desulfobacterales bacterium]
MEKNSKIYVCGHRGLVGSAILRLLQNSGYSNIITRSHNELDLERQIDVETFFQNIKPEYVFQAAAKVGGILANSTYPADFIYRNLVIQNNVLHSAYKTGVKRLLFLGSSCIYPKESQQPVKEEYLLTGPLEPTNQPYAIAKISGIIQCEAYNRQYGTRFLAVMPTNLYGINDNFDLQTAHVLPMLIRKFHLAKLAANEEWDSIKIDEMRFGNIPQDIKDTLYKAPKDKVHSHIKSIILWGSGKPYRELLHVDDLANACLFLMNLPENTFSPFSFFSENHGVGKKDSNISLPLINIGYGQDCTIKELAELVSDIVGYKGEIIWDSSKPDGTPRKILDNCRIRTLGWKPNIFLQEGIKSAYDWYLSIK